MEFSTALRRYQQIIEKQLAAFIDSKRDVYCGSEVERWLFEVLDDFVLRGGKRIRAIMTISAYEGATGEFEDPRIAYAACAMEFLDAYFLVQDDIIDLSDLRRGRPSAHAMLAEYAQERRDVPAEEARTFGYNAAIGVGDIFNAWGIECLLSSDFPAERTLSALHTYNSACEVICRGEIKDIYLGLSTVTADEEQYMDMILQKTAHYVTRAPALIGLDLAGASGELREAMVAFTEPLGVAFQIRDDMLDLLSTEEQLGKPVGTDIREGKDTLLIIHARQYATPAEWERVRQVLGNHFATDQEISFLREVLEHTGSFEYAEECMHERLSRARAALGWLERCGLQPDTVAFYEELTDFVGSRKH